MGQGVRPFGRVGSSHVMRRPPTNAAARRPRTQREAVDSKHLLQRRVEFDDGASWTSQHVVHDVAGRRYGFPRRIERIGDGPAIINAAVKTRADPYTVGKCKPRTSHLYKMNRIGAPCIHAACILLLVPAAYL